MLKFRLAKKLSKNRSRSGQEARKTSREEISRFLGYREVAKCDLLDVRKFSKKLSANSKILNFRSAQKLSIGRRR